jgi:hypothetical protein
MSVAILILGRGWAGSYIADECVRKNVPFAATTRDGRDDTLRFDFDIKELEQYAALPVAAHILITFPIKSTDGIDTLVSNYASTHAGTKPQYILLGSTGVFIQDKIITRSSSINPEDLRGKAEEHLMCQYGGIVLSLSGLYGGSRHPRSWLSLVAKSKLQLSQKHSLHLIHGVDIALSILKLIGMQCADVDNSGDCGKKGSRWILTDMRVYDWWDIAMGSEVEEYRTWARELMQDVVSLPRSNVELGRVIDGKEYWDMLQSTPSRSFMSEI